MRVSLLVRRGLFAAIVASLSLSPMAHAATTTTECGLFHDYTAPDPLGPTPGSITFGLNGAAEPIAPDAVLTPPADSVLPALQGGVPTCLSVQRDAGAITALAFVPSGTVSGPVVLVPDLFGPGQDAYVIADRIFAPVTSITDNVGLAALIKTAADSDSSLSITFQIDLASGIPTGFTATTSVAGPVTFLTGGDVQVGAATLPNAVIDAPSRARLNEAAALHVPATVVVDGVGTLSQSSPGGVDITITLSVTFVPPPTPVPTPVASAPVLLPNTSTEPPTSPSDAGWWQSITFSVATGGLGVFAWRAARPSRRARRRREPGIR